MSSSVESEDEARRLVEASAWRVRLTALGAESTAEFEEWLAEDPHNQAAWRRAAAPWDFLGEHAAAPELLAARSAALRAGPGFGRAAPPRTFPWASIAAAALLTIAAIGAGGYWWLQPVDYRTALGERRTLALSDGSRLTLDSDSEVQVSYGRSERDLTLVRGQARFEVAHDPARPFLVTAGHETVRATGTDFDVDAADDVLTVTLIEGRVIVFDAENRVPLTSGEQVVFAPQRKPVVKTVAADDVLAWQNGQVVFHDAALSEVLARLNRYDGLKLVLADPALAQRRVSGTFNTGNAQRVAGLLAQYLGLRAVFTDEGRIELRA